MNLGVGVMYGAVLQLLEGEDVLLLTLVRADRITVLFVSGSAFSTEHPGFGSIPGRNISEYLPFQWPPCWRHRLSGLLSSSVTWAQGLPTQWSW